MIRKNSIAGVFGAAALVAFSSAAVAQTSSTSQQGVAPSAGSTVNSDARFKAMPHSNVTISPSATTNQSTAASQTTGTAGAGGTGGTTSSSNQGVAPSAGSTVNSDARFKAMPHSNVTISPSATTNQSTSASQTTGTAGAGGGKGKGNASVRASGGASSSTGGTAAGAGGSVGAKAGVSSDRDHPGKGKGKAKGHDRAPGQNR